MLQHNHSNLNKYKIDKYIIMFNYLIEIHNQEVFSINMYQFYIIKKILRANIEEDKTY